MNWKLVVTLVAATVAVLIAGCYVLFSRADVGSSGDLIGPSISHVETCVPLTPPQDIPTHLAHAIPVERCVSTWYESYPILPAEACGAEAPPPTLVEAPGFVLPKDCPTFTPTD
jgi:hypothetical protein